MTTSARRAALLQALPIIRTVGGCTDHRKPSVYVLAHVVMRHYDACATRSQFLGRHVPLYPNLEQFVNYFAQGLLFWEALL